MLSAGMPGKLAILDVVLQVDKRGLATGLAQSRAMLRSETKSMAAEVGAAAATMAKAMAVPMLAISGFAVKMAADFDREMTKSIAIMGDVSAAMRKQMAQTAKDTARSLNLSVNEMAKSYFYLASAGFDAAQSIGALPAVATFAKAGAFDLALAVDLLTDAQTALGMTAWDTAENLENLVRISDLLIGANTLANASTQQFSEALTNKAAASLKIYGKSLEEGLSVLAAFADAGKKGSEAGELLSRFITQIGKASLRNAEAWKQYGIAVFDAGGKMRDVADIVEDMEKAMEGLSDKQKDVMFTELGLQLRMKDTVQVLLGASDKMRGYQRRLEEMSGVTRDVAEKQMQTFHERLGLVLAEFRALAVQLGEELIPILETGLLPKLKDAGEFLRTLSSATKAAAWDFVSFEAKIIAATVALGALIRLAKANPLILAFAAGYGGGGLMAASYGAATQRGTDFLRDLQETEQILGTARGALHAPKLDPWVAANRHRAQEFGIPAGLGLDATDAQLSLHRPFPSGANADFLAGMPYGEALPLAFQAADFLRNLETTSPEMVEPMRKGLQTGEIDVNQLRQAIDALALVEQNAQAIDSVMNRVAETFAEAGDSAGGLADFDEEEIAEGAGSAVSDAILDSFPDEELRKRMIESAQALREHLFPVEFLKTQLAEVQALWHEGFIDRETLEAQFAEVYEIAKGRGLELSEVTQEAMEGITEEVLGSFREQAEIVEKEFAEKAFRKLEEEALSSSERLILELQRINEVMETFGETLSEDQIEILTGRAFRSFALEGVAAFEAVTEAAMAMDPAIAKAVQQLVEQEQLELIQQKWEDTASTMAEIGFQLGRMPGDFKKLGQASQSASRIVSIAMNFMANPILGIISLLAEAVSLMGLFGDEGEKVAEGLDKAWEELGEALEQWGDRVTDMLVEMVKTGELTIGTFIEDILSDVLRIGIGTLITEPIIGFLGDIFSAKGNVFGHGDVQAYADGGIIGMPMMFGTAQGKRAVVGEGPDYEGILPLARDNRGKLGVRTVDGMGSPGVNIQIIDRRGSGAPPLDLTRTQQGFRLLILSELEQFANSSRMDSVMGQRYGLRRAPR